MGGRNTFDYFLGEYEGKSVGYDREILIYNEKQEETSVIGDVKAYFTELWENPVCKVKYEGDRRNLQKRNKPFKSVIIIFKLSL